MLLEALVGCAGVTLNAVATALGVRLRDATVRAEGDLDFRGTLGSIQGCAGRFSADTIAVRSRHRCERRATGYSDSPDRTVLRCLPNFEPSG
jgi:hypothetical protein